MSVFTPAPGGSGTVTVAGTSVATAIGTSWEALSGAEPPSVALYIGDTTATYVEFGASTVVATVGGSYQLPQGRTTLGVPQGATHFALVTAGGTVTVGYTVGRGGGTGGDTNTSSSGGGSISTLDQLPDGSSRFATSAAQQTLITNAIQPVLTSPVIPAKLWTGDLGTLNAVSGTLPGGTVAMYYSQLFRVQTAISPNMVAASVNTTLPIPTTSTADLIVRCTSRTGGCAGPVSPSTALTTLLDTLAEPTIQSDGITVTFDPKTGTKTSTTMAAAQVVSCMMLATHPYYVAPLGTYSVSITGTNTTTTVDISALGLTSTTYKKCTVTIIGLSSNGNAGRRMGVCAWLVSPTQMLVQSGIVSSSTITATIRITGWFGSGWKVAHGYAAISSPATAADITLYDTPPADITLAAQGSTYTVAAWNKAFIFTGQFSSTGAGASGGNYTVFTDPIWQPGGATEGTVMTAARYVFSSAFSETNVYCHVQVVEDVGGVGGTLVTRFDSTATASGTTAIDVTSASLFSVEETLVLTRAITTKVGNGTDGYHFGSVYGYLNTPLQAYMVRTNYTEVGTFRCRMELVRLPRYS